jgi:hypothetical protein
MQMKSISNMLVRGIAVAMLAAVSVTAKAGNTSGKGSFSSADGTLPTSVQGGQSYACPLTVKANANGWPCSVTAVLKSQCWADLGSSTTVDTEKGTIKAGNDSVSFTASIYLKPAQAKLVSQGKLWWEVTVQYIAPTIKKPTDSFKTTAVTFKVKK